MTLMRAAHCLTLFDHRAATVFSLLTAMATTVWHLQPLRKSDIGKFSANGTKVEIRKLVKFLHQGFSGYMEISQRAVS